MQISGLSTKPIVSVKPVSTSEQTVAPAEFNSVLRSAINQVESSGHEASSAVEKFLSGGEGELHSTLLATQRASLEFDMFLQVRNKVVQAYQEVMRMQL